VETIFPTCSIDRRQVQWEDYLGQLTPAEKIGDIWWKREDKFAPLGLGNINGSKLRQLIWLMTRQPITGVVSGAVMQSPQLVMVATVAKHLGVPCHQFSGGRRDSVLAAEAIGAETHLVNPGYAATLNSKARQFANEYGYLWIETNITIEQSSQPERIEAFHRVGSEQCRNIPDHIENLLIPAGSCNSLTSILYGLGRFRPRSLKNILLFRIMKNADKRRNWTNERLDIIRKMSGEALALPYTFTEYMLVDDRYCVYSDVMPFNYHGVHTHPRYEGKCLHYINDHLPTFRHLLNDKTMFWIIGSELR
jgi:1-aminocyclopropane-1-carboxylate deaminase/D-cysteine desulfhydrase-like pyridoxal-dependent ACC family enzyme